MAIKNVYPSDILFLNNVLFNRILLWLSFNYYDIIIFKLSFEI